MKHTLAALAAVKQALRSSALDSIRRGGFLLLFLVHASSRASAEEVSANLRITAVEPAANGIRLTVTYPLTH